MCTEPFFDLAFWRVAMSLICVIVIAATAWDYYLGDD
jgi:hypothetical protein